MASVREGIVDALVAAIDGVGKPAGLTVHRLRTRPIEQDSLPAILVYLPNESVDRDEGDLDGADGDTGPSVERVLTVRTEFRVKVPTGTAPDTALDPLYVWAVQAVTADGTLGGLALDVREAGTAWDLEEKNVAMAAAVTTFAVLYHTSATDPEESRS